MTVGDKVVCVDDSITPQVKISLFPNWVEEGETYTIRSIEGSFGSEPRILLNEIRNPSDYFPELGGKAEPGFAGRRFVPIEQGVKEGAIKCSVGSEEDLIHQYVRINLKAKYYFCS